MLLGEFVWCVLWVGLMTEFGIASDKCKIKSMLSISHLIITFLFVCTCLLWASNLCQSCSFFGVVSTRGSAWVSGRLWDNVYMFRSRPTIIFWCFHQLESVQVYRKRAVSVYICDSNLQLIILCLSTLRK